MWTLHRPQLDRLKPKMSPLAICTLYCTGPSYTQLDKLSSNNSQLGICVLYIQTSAVIYLN
jgi:hypothetical protein